MCTIFKTNTHCVTGLKCWIKREWKYYYFSIIICFKINILLTQSVAFVVHRFLYWCHFLLHRTKLSNIYSHAFVINTGETQTLIDTDINQVYKIAAIKRKWESNLAKKLCFDPDLSNLALKENDDSSKNFAFHSSPLPSHHYYTNKSLIVSCCWMLNYLYLFSNILLQFTRIYCIPYISNNIRALEILCK